MNKKSKWKRIKRDLVYNSKFLKVYEDKVKIPGREKPAEYFLTKKSDAVMVVAKTTDNKIVMIKEFKYTTGKKLLTLPAGHIEKNEDILSTAKRELLEETGYGGGRFTYCQKLYESPVQDLHIIEVFIAEGVTEQAEPKLESTEDIELKVMSIKEVKNIIKKGQITSASTLASLLASGILDD